MRTMTNLIPMPSEFGRAKADVLRSVAAVRQRIDQMDYAQATDAWEQCRQLERIFAELATYAGHRMTVRSLVEEGFER